VTTFLELETDSTHRARVDSIWKVVHPFAQASFTEAMTARGDHRRLGFALGIAAVIWREADLTGNGVVFERVAGPCDSCMALASRLTTLLHLERHTLRSFGSATCIDLVDMFLG
jgi:hypothetical protein